MSQSSKLDQLREVTVVVADTGDIDAIRKHKPVDATTNPSLVLKAASLPEYAPLVDEAVSKAAASGGSNDEIVEQAIDQLSVAIGAEIVKIIPGRISTEVSARLSFDTTASVEKAKRLIDLYESKGVSSDRILIKLASTWEGIRAAEALEKAGIQCNLTLLFSLAQAKACADAGAFLISPFVGRILDWFKKANPGAEISIDEDPGVRSVTEIYDYYKSAAIETIVMGASFRSAQQIEALAGCDRLTISPDLLDTLGRDFGELAVRLDANQASAGERHAPLQHEPFQWQMNENAMATEKLAEGIRGFYADQVKLERIIAGRLDELHQ
ncbi:MAG: transaldolase [Woeseiaceae bacterium]